MSDADVPIHSRAVYRSWQCFKNLMSRPRRETGDIEAADVQKAVRAIGNDFFIDRRALAQKRCAIWSTSKSEERERNLRCREE